MRGLIVLTLVFALTLAEDTLVRNKRRPTGGYSLPYPDARIESQERYVAELNSELDSLEARVNGNEDTVSADMQKLQARLNNFEGDECDHNQKSCGRHSGQCISKLTFCDGKKDCDNGFDEDLETTCNNPVPPGSNWHGHPRWDRCVDQNNHNIDVIITKNTRLDHYPGRIFLEAAIVEEYTTMGELIKKEWRTTGQMDFADRRMILFAPEGVDSPLALECNDALGRNKIASCRYLRESDKSECGRVILVRGV